jgi:hypothetical protein
MRIGVAGIQFRIDQQGKRVMQKTKISRLSLKSSAAALAFLGAAASAQAVETKFGNVQIIFDTTHTTVVSNRRCHRWNCVPGSLLSAQ